MEDEGIETGDVTRSRKELFIDPIPDGEAGSADVAEVLDAGVTVITEGELL